MKLHRILSLLCLIGLLLSAAACDFGGGSSTTPMPGSDAQPNGTPQGDTGYLSVPRRDVTKILKRHFCFEKDHYALSIVLPIAMTVEGQEDGSFSLMLDGENVGSMVAGNPTLATHETMLTDESLTVNDIVVRHFLFADERITDANERYFHRYVFSYLWDDVYRTATLTVKYREMNDYALEKMKTAIKLTPCYSDEVKGILPLAASQRDKPILILGNSFIYTSRIGAILQSMCQAGGKTAHEIVAVSRGYATVWGSWEDYREPIKSGAYAAVFMCGYYSTADVESLYPYQEACRKSNTPLVIFPAHNEGYGAKAAAAYPELLFLDWKNEIDRLIAEEGFTRDDFCINDQHQHSTPLAGYVGAQMIYRAVYGEVPLSGEYGELAERLGHYGTTGRLSNFTGKLYELHQ